MKKVMFTFALVLGLWAGQVVGVTVQPDELAQADTWFKAHLTPEAAQAGKLPWGPGAAAWIGTSPSASLSAGRVSASVVVNRTPLALARRPVPAGAVIWLTANIQIGGVSLAEAMIHALNPLGVLIGLNGVILVAYLFAIPANEIVIPTVLMLTVLVTGVSGVGSGAGVMFQLDNTGTLGLLQAGGWTLLTAVNLMLLSLIHNPCSTTLMTIFRETGSRRWTALAALIPLAMGLAVTFFVAQVWRLVAGAG